MSHLGCVHYEGRLLHVLTNSKEGKEPDTTLQRSLPVHETAKRHHQHHCLLHDADDDDDDDENENDDDDEQTAKSIVNIIIIFMIRIMMFMISYPPDGDCAWCNSNCHCLPIFPTHL